MRKPIRIPRGYVGVCLSWIAGDPIAIRELAIYFCQQQAKENVYYTEVRIDPNLGPSEGLQ